MRLHDVKSLCESSYPNNIGVMEMYKFYQIASAAQKQQLNTLIAEKDYDAAWQLLQNVVGVKLY